MIDLHCHILPGIDDGPGTTADALALAREVQADGVQVVAATPHLREDHPGVYPHELPRHCAELERANAAEGNDLQIIPAGEVDLVWALEANNEDLLSVTYDQRGTDVLVETPYGELTSNFEQILFDTLSAKGMRILLAHPERNPTLREQPDRVVELVRRGILLQVTAGSLVGRNRRSRTRKMAHALVKEGLAHVIASDSHGPAITRAPLSAGVKEAERLNPGRGRWMATDAPAAVLAGEPLPDPPARRRRRQRLFGS